MCGLQIPCRGHVCCLYCLTLFHHCYSWRWWSRAQCSQWAALVENCTVVISHHHCVCCRHISFTIFLTDCYDTIHIEFSQKLNMLASWKNKIKFTPRNVQMPLFSQTSKFWRTELSFSRMRETRMSKKTFFFLSDTTEWKMLISVNQCHNNGNKKIWFNYVSCILKCGQLWFALVVLKGQRLGEKTFRHCVFRGQIVWHMTKPIKYLMFRSGTSHNCLFSWSK